MKTPISRKSYFAQILVLIGLVGPVLVPGPVWGQSWTLTSAPAENWLWAVASSADGSTLAAAASDGPICISTNSGAAWTITTTPTETWLGISSSADGTKLVAAPNGTASSFVPLYVSTNA